MNEPDELQHDRRGQQGHEGSEHRPEYEEQQDDDEEERQLLDLVARRLRRCVLSDVVGDLARHVELETRWRAALENVAIVALIALTAG